jgi:iron complex outermembrane receptor protein
MSNFTFKIKVSFLKMILLFFFTSFQAFGQTVVKGTIIDAETKETLVGVNILVKDKVIGTITDLSGRYTLNVNQEPPFSLIFSMVGYDSKEVEITNGITSLDIALDEKTILGQEFVVAASRVEEGVLQSPVSIEKMDIIAIRDAPQASFYDALNNLKGVDMSTQSFTFKSFNTRGFNANGNVRTVQMIDGMDNQAPGLNFPVGNVVGISELDLESIELLPGASSSLYGPNAINGILLMTSKNPFQYQGLSVNMRTGIMDESGRTNPTTGYYDFSARYAKAFNDKVAFKVNVQYLAADDWQANDFRDQSLLNGSSIAGGTRENNPGFDGINIYGDETNVNMNSVAQSLVAAGILPGSVLPLIPNTFVSRTGYMERNLADYNTESLKLNAALHWRINDRVEAILQGSQGFGTTVYTGVNRYSIVRFKLGQYKAELKGSNWYLRAYTTQERSGDAFDVGIAAQGVNEAWKPSQQWYGQYVSAYAGAISNGANSAAAHSLARGFADQDRLMPGTSQFDQALAAVAGRGIPGNADGVGAKFVDKTNLYHIEGSYNLSNQIKFADFLVGANYRIYDLNSEASLFATDENGNEFNIREFGAYAQGSKKLFNDKFKLTASVRYDKNENFAGQFSPRVSGVFTQGNHNFRASYQTGFRIPTTQDQYLDLFTPQARLIGGLPLLRDKYNLTTGPVFTLQDVLSGNFTNPYQFTEFKPETVKSIEFGYKALWGNKMLVDAYYYNNNYENFIGSQVIVQPAPTPSNPTAGNVFSLPVTREEVLKSWGWALSIDYKLPKNYTIGGNISFNTLTNLDELVETGFQPGFNTPEYRYVLNFANREIVKNLGFAVAYRWQGEFVWQSTFVAPAVSSQQLSVMPAFGNFDAQISYKLKSLKSIVKVGGSNLFNDGYRQAWGNPTVGTIYFVSLTFDEFLN